MDVVAVTETQLRGHDRVHRGMYKASGPASQSQEQTSPWTHDKDVAQRVANGHVVVIGHGGQEHSLSTAQEVEEVELG